MHCDYPGPRIRTDEFYVFTLIQIQHVLSNIKLGALFFLSRHMAYLLNNEKVRRTCIILDLQLDVMLCWHPEK